MMSPRIKLRSTGRPKTRTYKNRRRDLELAKSRGDVLKFYRVGGRMIKVEITHDEIKNAFKEAMATVEGKNTI